jgi:hypothetical protein
LTASAAGRSERFGVGDDGDGVETAFTFADGFEDGDAFGADGESVGRVFDVADFAAEINRSYSLTRAPRRYARTAAA